MNPTQQKIIHYSRTHSLLSPDDHVLLACSAGPDSMYLAYFLTQYLKRPDQITLIYFDHGLRPKATKNEKELIQNFAKKHHCHWIIKTIPIKTYAKKCHTSLEMAGHTLRQAYLKHKAKQRKIKIIALAHHLDDACETLLLQLVRGTGFDWVGLRPKITLTPECVIVRPLLCLTKSEILSELQALRIKYALDASNNDPRFQRNHIRNTVLPQLAKLNPNYRSAFQKLLTHLETQHTYKSHLNPIYKKIKTTPQGVTIPVTSFKNKSDYVIQALLHEFLKRCQSYANYELLKKHIIPRPHLEFSSKHIQSLEEWLKAHQKGLRKSRTLALNQNYVLILESNQIQLQSKKNNTAYCHRITKLPATVLIEALKLKIKLQLMPNNRTAYPSSAKVAYLNLDRFETPTITIRPRQSKDRMTPFGSTQSKSVKTYMIDKKIPRSQRNDLPLFFIQNQLAWIMGHQIDDTFRILHQTKKVLKIEISTL